MKKRVYIIHGWDGSPADSWIPWLREELTRRGFVVIAPRMPAPSAPEIDRWVPFLRRKAKLGSDVFFVGHSVGCQAILRRLQTYKGHIGGCVFVAGWFTLKPSALGTREEKEIARPWLRTSINYRGVRKTCVKFTAILSDNDPFVSHTENARLYRQRLKARIVIDKKKGHYWEKRTTAPTVLREILKVMKDA